VHSDILFLLKEGIFRVILPVNREQETGNREQREVTARLGGRGNVGVRGFTSFLGAKRR
jgi:hypothetical protein